MILMSIDITKLIVFELDDKTHAVVGYLFPSKTKYSCTWCHKESDALLNDKTRHHSIWDDEEDNPVFHLLCCSPECEEALSIAIQPHVQELGLRLFQSYQESVKVEDD